MNLAEEMEHVETMDKKFLQKIFDRIDVEKKGAPAFSGHSMTLKKKKYFWHCGSTIAACVIQTHKTLAWKPAWGLLWHA